MEDVGCSAQGYHQYFEGIPSVQLRVFNTVERYHQYIGGISSVQWRDMINTVEGYRQYTVEGYHQYSGGYSVQWKIFSTVEGYHQYSRGYSVQWKIFSTVEGYHQYNTVNTGNPLPCLCFPSLY